MTQQEFPGLPGGPGRLGAADWDRLRRAASSVRDRAYAPYSGFPVGAAGLVRGSDGRERVVTGCNVENAAYGIVLCAECGLISEYVATGRGTLLGVAVVDRRGAPLMPCGRCRQLLWEHGGPELLVDTESGPMRMAALLPGAFDVRDLTRGQG